MSLLLLFGEAGIQTGTTACELRHDEIRIITGHVYQLSFKVRSNLAQQLNVKIQNSAQTTTSLNQHKVITADSWQTVKFEFTASATDHSSILRVIVQAAAQQIWFDKFRLYDLTLERKMYRIMRIQGSLLPGSFLQTLTLREKTSAETA